MLQLIRIVAGDEQAVADARSATDEPDEVLREASGFYLQQVLFSADANSYRVLGVNPGDDDEIIRDHYRWLARWLHPDRNPDEWEVIYSERVSNAWQNLRTVERRKRYDAALGQAPVPVSEPEPIRYPRTGPMLVATPDYVPRSAPMDLRWVPSAVLGALGVMALGVVFLYIVRTREESAESARIAALANAEATERLAPVELEPSLAVVAAPDRSVPDLPTQQLPTQQLPTQQLPSNETLATEALAPPPEVVPIEAQVVAAVVAPLREPIARPAIPAMRPVEASPPRPVAAATKPPAVPPPSRRVASATQAKPAPAASAAPRRLPAPAPAIASVPEAPGEKPRQAASEPATSPGSPRIGQRDANRLLGNFSRAYEQGDLQQMRELFAHDAQGQSNNVGETLADYRRVFDNTRERSLMVRDVNWFQDGENITIVAGYEASVTSRGGKERRTRGDIRLDLRRESDRWRIYRVRRDERPG